MFRHRQKLFLAAATILALGTASIAPAEAIAFKFTPTPFVDFPLGENLHTLKRMLGFDDYSMTDEYLLSRLRNQSSWGYGQVSLDDTVDSIPQTYPGFFGTISGGSITSPIYRSLGSVFVSRYSSNSYRSSGSIWHFRTFSPSSYLSFSCNSNLLINCSGATGWYFHRGLGGGLIYYGPIVVSDFSWGLPQAYPTITPTTTETPTPVSSIPEPSSGSRLLLGGAWLLRRKFKQIFLSIQEQIG